MRTGFPDVLNELTDLADEVGQLAFSLARKPDLDGLDSLDIWERTHMLASATEKVYTGCERVMARIAADVDEAPVSHDQTWHVTLLSRMSHPIAGRRSAVIGAGTYEKLDRLRSFRHRERNSYGITLDGQIVLDRAKEAVAAFGMFRGEVENFIASVGADDDRDGSAP